MNLRFRRDVKGLIKALGYKDDSDIRMHAALGLKDLGDPRAVPQLSIALHDLQIEVRKAAVEALCTIGATTGDLCAIWQLGVALQDEKQEHEVRESAAIMLVTIANFKDDIPQVRSYLDQLQRQIASRRGLSRESSDAGPRKFFFEESLRLSADWIQQHPGE
jgi:hypothetical protein